jgi:sulfite reductase beta subunit-like hemoprotein
VPVGRLRAEQLFEIVRLSREYGRGEVRLTHQQNVLIPSGANERLDELLAEPLLEELPANPPLFTRGLQTCTGKEFCGLAKVFTKDRAAEIARFLDAHVRVNGTATTSACTSPAARPRARSSRSPTSASRACSRSTTASSSRRWTSASAAGSVPSRASATS